MIALGFVLAVLMVPGFPGTATSPRWALLSVALPLMFALPRRLQVAHSLMVIFIGWGAVTLLWTANPYEGVDHLWKFFVLGLAFIIASDRADLRGLFIGLSVGMGLNSALVIAQYHFGAAWVPQLAPDIPSGFFLNRNFVGETAALVLAGAAGYRIWWGAALCVPAVVYSGARGAWLGLAIAGLVYLWSAGHRRWVLVLAAGGAAVCGYFLVIGTFDVVVLRRAMIWLDIANVSTPLGYGLGSFYTAFQLFMDRSLAMGVMIEHAHNDYAQMLFELGAFGLILFSLLVALSLASKANERYVVIVFSVEACFGFPTYLPVSAFIAFCCMGYCLCYRNYLQHAFDDCRILLCAWRSQRA